MEVGPDVVGEGESNTVESILGIEESIVEVDKEEERERTGVEVDVGFAGGSSQTRDMGTGLSSVITAHFSESGAPLKRVPSIHAPRPRINSSFSESPNSN